MKIRKGGISRNIDARKLYEYTSKGYTVVEETEDFNESDVVSKKDINIEDLKEMTIEELLSYAAINNIDVGKATSKDGILSKINAAKGGGVDGESDNT